MFINPVKPGDFVAASPKIEEIKQYIISNTQHFGNGPEGWFQTTLSNHREIFGAADTVSKVWIPEEEEEELGV